MFRPLRERTVRWRPLSGEGLEHLTLAPAAGADAIVARSTVIGDRGGIPYGVTYEIRCDAGWHVRSFRIDTTDGRRLSLKAAAPGRWTSETGAPLPAFDGCIDIDLAGTPFTNTLPIRRLGLGPADATATLRMLYIPFDSFEPQVDGQRYTCLEPGRLYRYEAGDRSFAADLPLDEDGLVTDYPTLFKRL